MDHLSSDDIEPRRTRRELAVIAVTTVLTLVLGFAVLVGPVAIALFWLDREGITAFTVVWLVIAGAWVLLLANAAIRDAETRGWIAVALFGWLAFLAASARRLLR
jgi:hypothetical protein